MKLTRVSLILLVGVLLGAALTLAYLQSQSALVTNNILAAAAATPSRLAQAAPATEAQTPAEAKAPATVAQTPTQAPANGEDVVVGVYERVSPAVVNITVSGAHIPLPNAPQDVPIGTGSGVIVNADGRILTNNHVVADAKSLDVTLADGTTLSGKVLGTDPGSDLAVVKVDLPADAVKSGKVGVATLGDSDKLKVGQMAIAIGNPFGYDHTVTVGVISGLQREIPSDSANPIRGGIQTDAAINPGNSGGPLLNSAGEVIGINTSIESPVRGSVGIGFAVPINAAKRNLDKLSAGQTVDHPWLGIYGTELTPQLVEQLGLTVNKGVYVTQAIKDAPAQKAGIVGAVAAGAQLPQTGNVPKGGDVITAVDGNPVSTVADIGGYLDAQKSVGDVVKVTVRRGNEDLTLEVTLGVRPNQ